MSSDRDFEQVAGKAIREAADYHPCMALAVNEEGKCVELWLDTGLITRTEPIPGECSDAGLIRCTETGRVVGVRLPLLRNNLSVHHDGPIRVNAGFRKQDEDYRAVD